MTFFYNLNKKLNQISEKQPQKKTLTEDVNKSEHDDIELSETDRLAELSGVKKAKPDFLDLDKDGDKKEPMKSAANDNKGMSNKQAKYFGKKNESINVPGQDITEWTYGAKSEEDYQAKKKELQRIQMLPSTQYDPELQDELVRSMLGLQADAKKKGWLNMDEGLNDKHGSCFDRGGADYYYGRNPRPHKGGVGGDSVPRIEELSPEEIADYMRGFEEAEKDGYQKQYDEELNEAHINNAEDAIKTAGMDEMSQRVDSTTTGPDYGLKEEEVDESGLQRYTGIKKYGKDGFEALQKAGREGADEEEKGRIKDKYLKKEDLDPADPDADYNKGEYDREGDMAKDDLRTVNDAAKELYDILDADENLPEWVQAKITKAMDYLDTTRDYMKAQKYEESVAEEKINEIIPLLGLAGLAVRGAGAAGGALARGAGSGAFGQKVAGAAGRGAARGAIASMLMPNNDDIAETPASEKFSKKYNPLDSVGRNLGAYAYEKLNPATTSLATTTPAEPPKRSLSGYDSSKTDSALAASGLGTATGRPVQEDAADKRANRIAKLTDFINTRKVGDTRKTRHGVVTVTAPGVETHLRSYDDVEDNDGSDEIKEPRGRGRPRSKNPRQERITSRSWKHKRSPITNKLAVAKEDSDVCPHCGTEKNSNKVKETTSGAVATAPADAAPKSKKGGIKYGKGIYDSINLQVEEAIAEGLSISTQVSTNADGELTKNMSINGNGEYADKLAQLLQSAGMNNNSTAVAGTPVREDIKNSGLSADKAEQLADDIEENMNIIAEAMESIEMIVRNHLPSEYSYMDSYTFPQIKIALGGYGYGGRMVRSFESLVEDLRAYAEGQVIDENSLENAPNPQTQDTDYMTHDIAGGLNKPKRQLNPDADSVFNPLAAAEQGMRHQDTLNMGPGATVRESSDQETNTIYKEIGERPDMRRLLTRLDLAKKQDVAEGDAK